MDVLISGIIIGTFYALLALGLSLIFGILKVVNFAHGEFFMIGAYVYALTALKLHLPSVLAIVPAVVMGVIAYPRGASSRPSSAPAMRSTNPSSLPTPSEYGQ